MTPNTRMVQHSASRSTLKAASWCRALAAAGATVGLAACFVTSAVAADITLADQPLFSTTLVPGNLALALSVEWPTATTPAYPSTTAYSASSTFLGYFDQDKCYKYVAQNTGTTTSPDYSTSYFTPYSSASSHVCASTSSVPLWSGNYMNWASMQTLDAFRWVLTGGYRSTDTTSSTILTKTYAATDSASVIPDKTATSGVSGATPFNWSSATTRIRNLGVRMYITGTGSVNSSVAYTGQNSYSSDSSSAASASSTYELYINVKVCDSSISVESNCTQYGSNYKPEGLMQQYSSKLRYSAFGYYNHSGTTTQQRDGGVMRARMKFIGPTRPVPGSASVTNDYPEWNSSTGVMSTNPDSADAAATQTFAANAGWSVSITNSGVMNYLNKFGYSAKSYKSKDPVSELYYSVLRYFKNLGNVSSYTTLSGAGNATTAATWLDGFPAITSDDVWKKSTSASDAHYGSPILYSCQKNFILGIGDVNTHRDANLYGSTIRSSLEPTLPSEVSSDTSVDVKTATDMVGKLEGISGSNSLGSFYGDSSSTSCAGNSSQCNSYYIAGLAYDAHTKDIRSDLSDTQTVNTYWMDVMEGQVYKHKNQYWLATKYGGFTVPTGFSPYASTNGTSTLTEDTWYSSSDTLTIGTSSLTYSTDSGSTDKRPDNYFAANQPDKMKEGLTKAFAKITSELSEATSTAYVTATPNQSLSGASYSASYNPKTWTGEVTGSSVSYSATDGTPTLTQVWSAASKLDALGYASRKIVTCCTSDGAALPFTSDALGSGSLHSRTYYTSFSSVPGVATASQSATNFVNYLRGDRTHETSVTDGVYRTRSHVLGDIVNSKALAVGAPSAAYYDMYNPGYSDFKRTYASRKTVVYAGANDGMLHAFDGTLSSSTGGVELFAYVPSFAYGDSSTAATSGLASLGNPSYTHHYFVDGSPQSFDVDFNRTGGASGSGDWRSILVTGLGKGGKGYFAIDVTNPTAWTSESAIAGKVLWEFTDSRMGYSYGDVQVVKTAKYGWVVVVASGYNNSDGKGYFFFINPKTGALLETVATSEGSTSSPLNLAYFVAYLPDETDYTAESLYAADLQGNVWRVDLTGTTGSYAAPTKIAKLTDSSGTSQPVTTPVRIAIDPSSGKRYVLVGTGRLLADRDISSTQVQTFYAIIDGTKSAFYTSSSLPTGVSFPITRSVLNANTNLLNGIGSAPAAAMGWYYDLSVSSSTGVAERITVKPDYVNGIIGVAINLPNGEACNPSGTGRVIAVSMADGKTVLVDDDGNLIATSSSSSSVITDLAFQNIGGKLRLIIGGGGISSVKGNYGAATSLKRLNWREVLTTD